MSVRAAHLSNRGRCPLRRLFAILLAMAVVSHVVSQASGPPGAACLVIEASNPGINAEVGVGRVRPDGKSVELLLIEPVKPVGRNEDDLLPAIDRACRAAGVRAAELRLIGVSTGPGGYTSLRVACAAAKMIAEASGAKCVSIPTALVAARGCAEAEARVGVLLAGKDDSAFLSVMPKGGWKGGMPVPQGALVTASNFPLDQVDLVLGDRHVPAPIQELLSARGVRVEAPRLTAAACCELVMDLARVDPVDLVPVYPREPDAVTLWRARSKR